MAIAMAVQRSEWVYVYDEKNRQLFSKTGTLSGYTSNTVSVKWQGYIYTYDEKGRQIGITSAR